ncbi:MAG: hypothetical protein QGG42_17280 [Phycisphaerae bacterium]|nr:hypothetical protein [Phycisphaerae bacterium]
MDNQKKDQQQTNRSGIIRAVQTPLGFFVLVVLVVEVILGVLVHSSSAPINTYALFGVIGILLILIVIVALLAYYRPEALRGIRTSQSAVQATIVYPPTEKDRYNQLFHGFSDCDFYAFNPPFEVEHAGKKIHEEALITHKVRYDSNVKSRYLLFTERSLENADLFFDALAEQIGKEKVDSDISRRYWRESSEEPGFTFFIGYKKGTPAIVMYPRAVMESGIPRSVIYIEGAEELLSILREYFLKQWSRANRNG